MDFEVYSISVLQQAKNVKLKLISHAIIRCVFLLDGDVIMIVIAVITAMKEIAVSLKI